MELLVIEACEIGEAGTNVQTQKNIVEDVGTMMQKSVVQVCVHLKHQQMCSSQSSARLHGLERAHLEVEAHVSVLQRANLRLYSPTSSIL